MNVRDEKLAKQADQGIHRMGQIEMHLNICNQKVDQFKKDFSMRLHNDIKD